MKKIYFALVSLLLSLSVSAADWYISGDFQGWNHCSADYKFTESAQTPGVYTLQLPTGKSIYGSFLIVQGTTPGNPDWNNKIGTNGSKVKEGEAYKYVKGAGNFTMDSEVANATLTLDTNAGTLLVAGEAQENEYTTVYIVGDMGGGWQGSRTDYPLTLKSGTDNTWTGTYTLTAANSYFKFLAGTLEYGPEGWEDVTVEPNESYTAVQGSSKSFKLPAGEYTFTYVLPYNGESGTLTVTGEEIVEYPETLYVIGNINNLDFLPNNLEPLTTLGEGLYEGEVTFTGTLATGFSYFQFCTAMGTSDSDWAGLGVRYGATEASVDPTGTTVSMTNNDYSWKVADGKYKLEVSLVDKTLTVTAIEEPQNDQATATFHFSTYEEMAAEYPELPAVDSWTAENNNKYFSLGSSYEFAKNNISMTLASTGSNVNQKPRFYLSGSLYNLRVAKNVSTITVNAPAEMELTKIVITSNATSDKSYTNLKVTTDGAGSFTQNTTDKTMTWEKPTTGNSSFSTIAITSPDNASQIASVTIEAKKISTGIENIAVDNDENAPVEYFNLQGVKVVDPSNGIYIRRQGNKATKVLVK